MTTPSLATPAATMAICSAVARTSNWPIAACAVCGALRSPGNTEVAAGIGTSKDVLKPNFSACACSDVAPEVQADVRERRVAGDLQRLLQGDLPAEARLGRRSSAASPSSAAGRAGPARGSPSSVVYFPLDSAAAAVTILNVEPGG